MRAEEFLTEGREKYNWDLHKPGFEFSQKINGITYTVKRKNQFLNVKARDKQGRKIGSTWFVNHQYKDALEAGQTFVDPEFRGQGIATNMYAVVRMLGANIHPSTTQSDDGKAMWNKWDQQGDAKHIKSMNAQMTEQDIEESANPADTLYFFDVAKGGRSFDHLDLRIMGLKRSQKGRWYYQPGRNSTDLLTTATLKYLEKTLNVPARAWTKPVDESRIIDPERVDVYYRPVPGSRGRRVVARNIPTSTLEPLLQKLSEKYAVPVESFEWTPTEPMTEAFDQPYAIQWTKINGDWHATADLDDGSELVVLFMSQGDNQWMVEFERDENMEITGEGDAPRVFATVLMAMRQFIAKRKPAMLNFSAEKEDDPTGSRARLYDRMVQRYISGTGYTLTRQDYPGGATYTLTKQAQGVAENFADGKGPGRPGDSVRHGIPKHATMAELEKASHAKGRKGQLARWQLNMRRGRKK